jgi:uridine kinase
VLILEGIFALHDPRVLSMLDLRIFAEADPDLCLSRRLLRDVKHRGRDIEGCIKQWFNFVKPNFLRYVEPQRHAADIIVPRGIENKVAIGMVSDRIHKTLAQKSMAHQQELKRLGKLAENVPLGENCIVLERSSQVVGINTLLLDPLTDREDFIFYFDRMACLLVEKAAELQEFKLKQVVTATGYEYMGMVPAGNISAVVILRGGCVMEPALQKIVPACLTGRILIQTNLRTGEPELHYQQLQPSIAEHSLVMLLDAQMSSGGAALMAVRVLVDHGVPEEKIVFCTYMAGRKGIARLLSVYPDVRIVVGRIVNDLEERWVEIKYLGC